MEGAAIRAEQVRNLQAYLERHGLTEAGSVECAHCSALYTIFFAPETDAKALLSWRAVIGRELSLTCPKDQTAGEPERGPHPTRFGLHENWILQV
jgi:hypothetical protein